MLGVKAGTPPKRLVAENTDEPLGAVVENLNPPALPNSDPEDALGPPNRLCPAVPLFEKSPPYDFESMLSFFSSFFSVTLDEKSPP